MREIIEAVMFKSDTQYMMIVGEITCCSTPEIRRIF
jgi:hypothetical protein